MGLELFNDDDRGPDDIGEAWIDSINPIELWKAADKSSDNLLPFGIGYFMNHPSALASPQLAEIIVLDHIFRVGKAAWELASIPYDIAQDLGEAKKDRIDAKHFYEYAQVDFETLHPIKALQNVGRGMWEEVESVGHTFEAIIVEPIKNVLNAVGHII